MRQTNTQREVFQLLTYSTNGHSGRGWPKLKILCGYQRLKYLSHHLLHPGVCISRKLGLEWSQGVEPTRTLIWDVGSPSGFLTSAPNIYSSKMIYEAILLKTKLTLE